MHITLVFYFGQYKYGRGQCWLIFDKFRSGVVNVCPCAVHKQLLKSKSWFINPGPIDNRADQARVSSMYYLNDPRSWSQTLAALAFVFQGFICFHI